MSAATARLVDEGCTVKVTAGANLNPGDVVVWGNFIGIVGGTKPVASGDEYTLQLTGKFKMPILGTDTPAAGALLYWDAGNTRLTTTASTHKSAGIAAAAKGSGPTTIECILNFGVASTTI